MELIIHLGIHKTGTSALQKAFSENRKLLLENGVLFPESFQSELNLPSVSDATAGHRKFDSVLINPYNETSVKKIEKLKNFAIKNNASKIILSSETFFAPRVKIHPEFGKFADSHFENFKVVLYLRRPDSWAESMYREVLCWPRRRETRSYNKFCMEFLKEWLFFGERVRKLSNVFAPGTIDVISFDDLEEGITDNFKKYLGLGHLRQILDTKTNPSLPYNNIIDLQRLNKTTLSDEEKSLITQKMFKQLVDDEGIRSKYQFDNSKFLNSIKLDITNDLSKLPHLKNVNLIGNFDKLFSPLNFEPREIEEYSVKQEFFTTIKKTPKKRQKVKVKDVIANSILLNVFTNEDLKTIVFHIEYHLILGIDKILVQYDGNAEKELLKIYADNDSVEIISFNENTWTKYNGSTPESNAEKLSIAHKYAFNYAREHNFEWHMNIDSDELFYINTNSPISAILRDQAQSGQLAINKKILDQIIVPPIEAVHLKDDKNKLFFTRYFKNLTHYDNATFRSKLKSKFIKSFSLYSMNLLIFSKKVSQKLRLRFLSRIFDSLFARFQRKYRQHNDNKAGEPWTKERKRVTKNTFPEASKYMNQNFLGHTQGRVISNTSVHLDKFKSHRHNSSKQIINSGWAKKHLRILHYDAINYQHWLKKMDARVFGKSIVQNISMKRYDQQVIFQKMRNSKKEEKLFEQLYCIEEKHIKMNKKYNLLIEINNEKMLLAFEHTVEKLSNKN